MTLWFLALAGPVFMQTTSGLRLPTAARTSNNSIISDRASVSAGECLASPSTITIPVGDYADFASPNYPNNYECFQKCSWNFQTDADAQLSLSCDPVYMSWFSALYVIDQGTRDSHSCFVCGDSTTYKHTFQSNTATVGLQNDMWFTNKGFSCRISSEPVFNNDGCKCGVAMPTRIVGGEETAANEYPWMALLVSPGLDANFCGGSLITDEFVLTAAHCTAGRTISDIQVRLGIHDKYINPSGSLRQDVLQIIDHPSYNDPVKYDYDASLLRISAVDFSSYANIRPICLPSGSDTYDGQQAIAAGWGTTSAGGSVSSVLMAVAVPVISNSECNDLLPATVSSSMVCAGSEGLDSCQGDSGGPLFLSEGSGYQVVIGIVSWGYGCGDPGYPGVYARVTEFQSWIASEVAGSTVCPSP